MWQDFMTMANKCKQVTTFEYYIKNNLLNHQTVAEGLKLNNKILCCKQNKIQ